MNSYTLYPNGEEASFELSRPVLTQLIFDGRTKVNLYTTTARKILPLVTDWSFNRPVDAEHVAQLKAALKAQKYPYFIGTVKCIRDVNGMKVIDAQHRLAAIREICSEDINMDWDMNLVLEVFDVEFTDDVTCIELITLANNNRIFTKEDLPDTKMFQLMEAIMNDPILKGGIVDKQSGTVHRPRIVKKELYEFLKRESDIGRSSIPEIVDKLKAINNEISMMSEKDIYGRDAPSEQKHKQWLKARECKFFLNLMSPKWGIEKIVKMLVKPPAELE